MKKSKKPVHTLKKFTKNHLTVVTATSAILLLSAVSVIAVSAYLSSVTEDKLNRFYPMTYTNTEIEDSLSTPTISMTRKSSDPDNPNYHVLETSTNVTKSAVVHNLSGDDKKPVYVRVAVVPTVRARNADGIYENIMPFLTDFSMTFTVGSDWTKVGDYYYYVNVVDPDGRTSPVFSGNTVNVSFEADDSLIVGNDVKVTIDVIADTIQAVETDTSDRTKWTYTNALALAQWGSALSNVLTIPAGSTPGGSMVTGEGTGEGGDPVEPVEPIEPGEGAGS